MQTLVEKICGQKIGEDMRYRTLWPDEIRIPAIFPGRGVDLPMELPGPKMPTGIPLEVRLGYQAPQHLYAMYSFGINDGPMSFSPMSDFGLPAGGYEPVRVDLDLAYERLTRKKGLDIQTGFEPIEQPYSYKTSHNGEGSMWIHRETGDCLHTFQDGGAHIDLGGNHQIKLGIERVGSDPWIKDLGGYF